MQFSCVFHVRDDDDGVYYDLTPFAVIAFVQQPLLNIQFLHHRPKGVHRTHAPLL